MGRRWHFGGRETRVDIDAAVARNVAKGGPLARLMQLLTERHGEEHARRRIAELLAAALDGFGAGYVRRMGEILERVFERRARTSDTVADIDAGRPPSQSPHDFRKDLEGMSADLEKLTEPDPVEHAADADMAEVDQVAADIVANADAPVPDSGTPHVRKRGESDGGFEARKRGWPQPGDKGFPRGYHWRLVDGEPVLVRNPNAQGPHWIWDPIEKRFDVDAAGSWPKRRYEDSGVIDPCFPRNTVVKTPQGDRFIEDLKVGDLVYGWDFSQGAVVEQPVTGILRNWTDRLVALGVHGATVFATPEHRFWNAGELDWTHALDLVGGSHLWRMDRFPVRVEGAAVQSLGVIDTYNLDVYAQTYFVGAAGYLVHNGAFDESAFRKSDPRRKTTIYGVYDTTTDPWTLIYIGKTHQSEGDEEHRFREHLDDKPDWRAREDILRVRSLKEGFWNDFETAVWEKHYIDKNGGLDLPSNPHHTTLENTANPVSRDKYEHFQDGYGHDPCR